MIGVENLIRHRPSDEAPISSDSLGLSDVIHTDAAQPTAEQAFAGAGLGRAASGWTSQEVFQTADIYVVQQAPSRAP